MSEKNTPRATGQDTGLNDPTLHVDIREELAALQRDIASVHVACDRLHAHVIASHGEREPAEPSEAELEPDSVQAPEPPHVPPLALRCDGKTLVSVTQFGEMDLSTHERWEGVVLTEAETLVMGTEGSNTTSPVEWT